MSEPILQVKNLTTCLQIGKHAYPVVDNFSFNLYPGHTLAIVGESGSGKTMAALSVMRILPEPPAIPSEGTILFHEKNLLTLSEKEMRRIRGARIAMIFQDPSTSLNPVYTIGDQIFEVAQLHLGLYGEAAFERVVKSLAEVGIQSPAERLNDYPHQLSGGMKQRVMIAMALMCEPDILIADEPTTALDVTIQAQVLELIRHLQKRKGTALLLITHDMGVVAEMADDVIVMYAGQAVERGSVNEIFDHMAHPYTVGLFKSRPGISGSRERLHVIKGSVPPITHFPKGCRFHPRCPYMMEKCYQKVPDFAIEKSVHKAKCWLYDGTLESQQRKLKVVDD